MHQSAGHGIDGEVAGGGEEFVAHGRLGAGNSEPGRQRDDQTHNPFPR